MNYSAEQTEKSFKFSQQLRRKGREGREDADEWGRGISRNSPGREDGGAGGGHLEGSSLFQSALPS